MLRLFSDGRRVARERERAPRAAGSPWRRQWRWHRVAVGAAAVAPLPWFDCSAGDNWRRPVWHFDIATRLQTWLVPGFPLFLIFLFIFFFSFLCFLSSLPSSLTCSISHLPLCLSVCLCISFSARLLYWLNLLRCRPSCLFPPPPPLLPLFYKWKQKQKYQQYDTLPPKTLQLKRWLCLMFISPPSILIDLCLLGWIFARLSFPTSPRFDLILIRFVVWEFLFDSVSFLSLSLFDFCWNILPDEFGLLSFHPPVLSALLRVSLSSSLFFLDFVLYWSEWWFHTGSKTNSKFISFQFNQRSHCPSIRKEEGRARREGQEGGGRRRRRRKLAPARLSFLMC